MKKTFKKRRVKITVYGVIHCFCGKSHLVRAPREEGVRKIRERL